MPPIWRDSIPDTYDQGAPYTAALNYDGEPAPKLSLIEGPPSMFLGWLTGGQSNNGLYWNGDSPSGVTVTLRVENSEGTADLSTTLTPTPAPPIVPPVILKRITANVEGGKIRALVEGFTPSLLRLYVKRPGTTIYVLGSSTSSLVGPNTYEFSYVASPSGTYSFQAQGRYASGRYVWSNPVTMEVAQ